jgi:ribose 5-phosphate isomerase A
MTPRGIAMSLDANAMKKLVAEEAVNRYVKDGMTVGLGTGSTAKFMIERIGELVKQGYDLTCTATSVQSEELAKSLGIKVLDIDEIDHLDITIDGADEVDPGMQLIKGLGGALLREKIVAAATVKEIIIADESKLVEKLGTKAPLPVEVLCFGHEHTKYALERQGCKATLRMRDGKPFVTDGGNYIYDCKFEAIERPFFLESRIDVIPGVVENGLFLNTAYDVLIAKADGTVESMADSLAKKEE